MNSRNETGRITRKQFIRKSAVGAAAIGLGLGRVANAALPPVPAPPTVYLKRNDPNPDPLNIIPDGAGGWHVHPDGDPNPLANESGQRYLNPLGAPTMGLVTADSRNIQWAVNNVPSGGTVRLMSKTSPSRTTSPGPGMPLAFEFPPEYPGFSVRVGYPFQDAVSNGSYGCVIEGETDASDNGPLMPDGVTRQFPNGRPVTQINKGMLLFNLATQNNKTTETIVFRNVLFNEPVSHVAGAQPMNKGNVVIDNCIIQNLRHSSVWNYAWTIGFWSFQKVGSMTVSNCLITIPDDTAPWIKGWSLSASPFVAVIGISMPYNIANVNTPFPRTATISIVNNTIDINATNYKYPVLPDGGADSKTGIAVGFNQGVTNITGNVLNCRPSAIWITHLKNAVIANNHINFPGQVSAPFDLTKIPVQVPEGVSQDYSSNAAIVARGNSSQNTFSGNVATGFHSDDPRIGVGAQVLTYGFNGYPPNLADIHLPGGNLFSRNAFGPTDAYGAVVSGNGNRFELNSFGRSSDDTMPCIFVTGSDNVFERNDFTRTGLKGFLYQVSANDWIRAGDILFDTGTSGNAANVSFNDFSPGDRCSEVADLTFSAENGGANSVTFNDDTYCPPEKQEHLTHMLAQADKYIKNKRRIAAMQSGQADDYSWLSEQ